MKAEKIYKVWKKYIDNTYLYRVVSEEHIPRIQKHGLEHNYNPYEKQKKDIFTLFRIVLKLKKNGFIMMHWWGKPVDQEIVVKCTKKDLTKQYIDFTPNNNNILKYYQSLKGGALVHTVKLFTEELLAKKPPLPKENWKIITKLHKWSAQKSTQKNSILKIKASSPYLQTAHFQDFTQKYVESPFGSFAHFQKVIKKRGLEYYLPFLQKKKLFYLRTRKAIPSSEIQVNEKNLVS